MQFSGYGIVFGHIRLFVLFGYVGFRIDNTRCCIIMKKFNIYQTRTNLHLDFLGENEIWTMKNYFFDKHVLFILTYDQKGINALCI